MEPGLLEDRVEEARGREDTQHVRLGAAEGFFIPPQCCHFPVYLSTSSSLVQPLTLEIQKEG